MPWPAIVTIPSASQVAGEDPGVMRHVAFEFKPTLELASPPGPLMVVNVAVPPGITDFDSGVATGAVGIATVGVIVAFVTCPVVSATTYFTGDAVPVNVDKGSNVTVPLAFTV